MTTPLDTVIALLNAESVRLFGEPLDKEQCEAVFEEDQCFEMMDDMEARLGFNVTEARDTAARFYTGEDY